MRVVVLALGDPWAGGGGGTLRTRALLSALGSLGHDGVCLFPGEAAEAPPPGAGRSIPIGGPPPGVALGATPLAALKRHLLPMPTLWGARSRKMGEVLGALTDVDLVVVTILSQIVYKDAVPGTGLWLDLMDLWSDFAGREARARRGTARATAMLQQRHLRRLEDGAARHAAIVSAAGWADSATLASRTGRPVTWLPVPVAEPTRLSPPPAARGGRPVAGLLGDFGYWPNRDAFRLLVERWWPHLRAAGWEVAVAGFGSESLPCRAGMRALGPVAAVEDFYEQVDAALAPVRLGGGMKVKVAEALCHARPVIATPFALEGLPPELRAMVRAVSVEAPAIPSPGELSLPPEAPAVAFGAVGTARFDQIVASLLDDRP